MAPKGLGVWIWDGEQLGGNWASRARRCALIGIKWVMVRAGMFLPSSKEVLEAFGAYGIDVYTWHYSIPANVQKECSIVTQCQGKGSKGHILNPEVEYIGKAKEAASFVKELRGLVGENYFLGYAPFGDPDYFPTYPYRAFSKECVCMPQVYWTMWGRGAKGSIAWVDPMFKKLGIPYDMPALSVFGGNDPRHVNDEAGPFKLDDLKYALEAYKDKPAVSLWALESLQPIAEEWLRSVSEVRLDLPTQIDLGTDEGVQEALVFLGYNIGKVDGKIGPKTKAAIIAFQRRNGLTKDGVVGDKTKAALRFAIGY